MNITRVRDTESIDVAPVWYCDLGLVELWGVTAACAFLTLVLAWVCFRVFFRYNKCRW